MAENSYPLPGIVHHNIENGGGQLFLLMIYGEATKAREIVADGSSNPNKSSHLWEMRKAIKTTEKKIVDGDSATRPLSLERNKLALKG